MRTLSIISVPVLALLLGGCCSYADFAYQRRRCERESEIRFETGREQSKRLLSLENRMHDAELRIKDLQTGARTK